MPKLSIYLIDKEAEKLEKMATDENRSVSNMVATLVREGFSGRYVTKSVGVLPAPIDADKDIEPIALVTVAEA